MAKFNVIFEMCKHSDVEMGERGWDELIHSFNLSYFVKVKSIEDAVSAASLKIPFDLNGFSGKLVVCDIMVKEVR